MKALETDFLILGGGVGGLVTANRLRSLRPSDAITVIDKAAQQSFQPSLLWVASGARRPHSIVRSLKSLAKKRIDFVEGEVQSIDTAARAVRLASGQEIAARKGLVIALGTELRPELVPGLAEAGLNLYTLEGSAGIDAALASFPGGRVAVVTAEPVYKCPAAPYEAALLIDARLRNQRTAAPVSVTIYAAEAAPMATAGANVAAAVKEMLQQRGIAYLPEHKVTHVDGAAKLLQFANGQTAAFDLLVYVPPHRAPKALESSGLLGPAGWIPVDRHTLATLAAGVFAIGDNTTIPLSIGKPLPKAGIFAHAQAEVVAHNLAHPEAPRQFDGHGKCFIETGFHRAGMGSGNFYAEPSPQVKVHAPAIWWHWGKVLFEKSWLFGQY